jgi:formate dehydrogenase gamma subunit
MNKNITGFFKERRLIRMIPFMLTVVIVFGAMCLSEGNRKDAKIDFSAADVCPPFYLKDEAGNIIDPVHNVNAGEPYSPKQTCGAVGCHDYNLITKGYHFTQGKGENPTKEQQERVLWALTPGNYGGSWCSPAPLYRYLSPKHNKSPRTMDMTSFSFIPTGCGACHPGGGPLEYDRSGNRYDDFMMDKKSGLISGGDNNFDGDYYQALWDETGVLEADCLICHQPEYDNEERKKQLKALNFRWAATAGSDWGTVTGSIQGKNPVEVVYDKSLFNEKGKISPQLVREPRNDACLFCHAQPGWKKRGSNFSSRTDVHIQAGLKCVDCHRAGTSALDERIQGKEIHQIGKGDDPGGLVRDDLDNTFLSCKYCHDQGHLGAPIPRHKGMPAIHLDRIACQSCHIRERTVKPAQFQAGDVFNPGTKIPSKGKHLWVFYGHDLQYYNHYGNMEMMGYDDKPTETFKPTLAKYNGQIFPVNRVHSAWPAIEIDGEPGLMQPLMSDIYRMWSTHFQDPAKYPDLAKIKDDNNDGVIEVNRPQEIEALISAVTAMLKATEYPMDGKRVVWAMNDRAYYSGTEFRTMPKKTWEASPYGNVHKYNHDVYPAKAALGAKGCQECHSRESGFFTSQVLQYPFDEKAMPVFKAQHELLGMSAAAVQAGFIRESLLKPLFPWLIGSVVFVLLIHLAVCGQKRRRENSNRSEENLICRFKGHERLTHCLLMAAFIILGVSGFLFLLGRHDPSGPIARELHSWTGWIFILSGAVMFFLWARSMMFRKGDMIWLRSFGGYFKKKTGLPADKFNAGQKIFFWLISIAGLILSGTGTAMFFLRNSGTVNVSLLYTIHDFAAVLFLLLLVIHIYLGVAVNPETVRSIFGGFVRQSWLKEHHPGEARKRFSPQSKEN